MDKVRALYDCLNEAVRRGKRPIARYNKGEKVHKKQMAFHACPARNRWVFGGNRSGKTECGAVECVWRLRGIHPFAENKPVTGWAVSLTSQVQRDVAQRKILHYLPPEWIEEVVMSSGRSGAPELGVIDTLVVKNVFGSRSVLGFKSCEMGREKFQGASLDFVWFDEEPPQDVYEECRMRLMDKKGMMFGTMTPLKGLTFLHDEVYLNRSGDPENWYEFMEWADNPFLDPGEIGRMDAVLPEDELQTRRYGRFAAREGLVYPEFDENVHVIEPFDLPPDWQAGISIDPGLKNPLSCHFYGVDFDGNIYVVGEHYEADRDVEYHAGKIFELADRLNWKRDPRGRLRALIDPAAGQRTLASARSVAELFGDLGILTDLRVNKDLFAGISRVRRYLKGREGRPARDDIKSCARLIGENKRDRNGGDDRPRKQEDHALDELRYFVMSRPLPPGQPESLNEIQRDKLKLSRLVTARNRRRNFG